MPWGTKSMPPKKNLSRGSLSNWCDVDVDADADISKTICRPPPYGGVDINTPWICVIKVCSNGGATYIIGEIIANDNLNIENFMQIFENLLL